MDNFQRKPRGALNNRISADSPWYSSTNTNINNNAPAPSENSGRARFYNQSTPFDSYDDFRPCRKPVRTVEHLDSHTIATKHVLTKPKILPDAAGVTSELISRRSEFGGTGQKRFDIQTHEKNEASPYQYTSVTPIGESCVSGRRPPTQARPDLQRSDPFCDPHPGRVQKKHTVVGLEATHDHLSENGMFDGFGGKPANNAPTSRRSNNRTLTSSISFSPVYEEKVSRPYSEKKFKSSESIIHTEGQESYYNSYKDFTERNNLISESDCPRKLRCTVQGPAAAGFNNNIYGFAATDARRGIDEAPALKMAIENKNIGKTLKARDIIGNDFF